MSENPYAKYVSKAENPYAKYARSSGSAEPKHYKGSEVAGAALKNLPSSAKNFVGGMLEPIVHPVKTAKTLGLTALGVVEHIPGVEGLVGRLDPKTAKKAMETANAIGGMYAQRYGSWDAIKRTMAEDPVGFAADLSTLIGGGAGALKVAGATSKAAKVARIAEAINPMTANTTAAKVLTKTGNALAKTGMQKTGNALAKTGKVVGKIGPEQAMNALTKSAANTAVGVNNLMHPKEKAWLNALEGEGRKVINKVKSSNHEIVPGSKPTVAEAVSDLKLTKLSQMDQAAKKILPTQEARRQMTNESAQMEHMGKVAKTEQAMKAAESARETTTNPMYNAAKAKVAQADGELSKLLERPSMDEVMSRAARIAAEEGKPFKMGENLPERTVKSSILDADGKPIQVTLPAEFAKYPGQVLHYIKMGFDDLINDTQKFPPNIKSTELAKIKNTRQEFIDWMQKADKIPEYKVARETYAEMSKPIDRMTVGQYLEGKLAPVHGEDAGTLRATAFENALTDAPKTVKQSTGQTYVKKLEEILTPDEMKIVNGVRDDIRRSELNKRLAKFGRATEGDIKKIGTHAGADVTPPPLLNPVVTFSRAILAGLKNRIDNGMAVKIATELLAEDLNIPVAAIEKALAHELKTNITRQNITKAGKAVTNAAIRTPAIYNTLSPRAQNNNALVQ